MLINKLLMILKILEINIKQEVSNYIVTDHGKFCEYKIYS